jgi:hypothetical protein
MLHTAGNAVNTSLCNCCLQWATVMGFTMGNKNMRIPFIKFGFFLLNRDFNVMNSLFVITAYSCSLTWARM